MPLQIANEWLTVVNPNAGIRKGERDWPKIVCLLDRFGFNYLPVITDYPGHAIEIVKKKVIQGYRKIMVVGGDGTLNEVVNGILSQDIVPSLSVTVAMITVGTGNDWARTYNIPKSYKYAIKAIRKGNTFVQDAGRVSYDTLDGRMERYFVNLAGMGFDAQVAKRANLKKAQGKGGPSTYLINLFQSLMQYRAKNISIEIDGQLIKAPIFSMNVGICKYSGGGMMQAPHAVADDGLLALTVIKKLGKMKVIRNVKKLYDGSFVKLPEVSTYTGKSIRVSSEREILLEADGETLGKGPFDFSIMPGVIRVVTGG